MIRVILARYIAPIDFLSERECEAIGGSAEEPDWFGADFISGCRLDGDLKPTHWLPIYGLGIPYTVASIGPRDDDVRTCSKCGASILGIVARNGNETPVKYAPIETS